ncbi:hypothetical protein [Janthinobacterium sp. RT4P48]|uniref:hypothetical protein n=1 Tax=Janthinobacterium sp. RT4P48 TaxID=3424188 RepID=UPI003F25B57A
MFDFLNAVYLAAILFASITMYPVGETAVPIRLDGAVEVRFVREWWRDDGDGKCFYTGMVVPFERTWPEEIERGGEKVVLPPEPGKIAGYVAVIHRKECKGLEAEAILRAGIVRSRTLLFGSRGPQVDKHTFFPAGDMLETPAEKVQPWLPQVVERLERLSEQDKVAKAFLTASASELATVLPGRNGKQQQSTALVPESANPGPSGDQ